MDLMDRFQLRLVSWQRCNTCELHQNNWPTIMKQAINRTTIQISHTPNYTNWVHLRFCIFRELSDNQFTGMIPSEFGLMKVVTDMWVTQTHHHSHDQSVCLIHRKSMTICSDLSGNSLLTGSIPKNLSNLTTLTHWYGNVQHTFVCFFLIPKLNSCAPLIIPPFASQVDWQHPLEFGHFRWWSVFSVDKLLQCRHSHVWVCAMLSATHGAHWPRSVLPWFRATNDVRTALHYCTVYIGLLCGVKLTNLVQLCIAETSTQIMGTSFSQFPLRLDCWLVCSNCSWHTLRNLFSNC
jgi:hypothetical protein